MPPKRESEKVDLMPVKEEPSLENMEVELIVKKQFESVKVEPTSVKEEPESQEYEVSIDTSTEVYNCVKVELEVEFSPVAQSDSSVGDSEIVNLKQEQILHKANKDTAKTNPDCSQTSNSVDATHKCYICLNTFIDESTMYSHLCVPKAKEMEEHKKLYLCELCNIKKFRDEESLNAHKLKSHINEMKHSCQACQMWFKCELTLADHNVDVHGKVRDVKKDSFNIFTAPIGGYKLFKRYQCKICKKRFKRNSGLNRHVRLYHTSK